MLVPNIHTEALGLSSRNRIKNQVLSSWAVSSGLSHPCVLYMVDSSHDFTFLKSSLDFFPLCQFPG